MTVRLERLGPVRTVILDRPEVRNAVDRPTAEALAEAFREIEADEKARAAVLWGAGGHFSAGADLAAIAEGRPERANRVAPDGDGPLGPTRMRLTKPVIAAVAGYAVAGGLELALWCDLRVAEESAVFGVLCRRWGVPLVDGGTVRLPRLIGHSHAMDLILTGRGVCGQEALSMGLANRLAPPAQALQEAIRLAERLSRFPQACMRSDRLGVLAQWSLSEQDALTMETRRGLDVIRSGETHQGAERFAAGSGRHGKFE